MDTLRTIHVHGRYAIQVSATNTLTVNANSVTSGQSAYPLFIGQMNNAGSAGSSGAKIRLYSLTIYQPQVTPYNIIHRYLPAVDNKEIPCLVDTITDTILYNLGKGTPIVG